MVKVIGDAPEEKKQIVCKNCAKRLEYTASDRHTRHSTDYGGGPAGNEWIVCPNCENNVITRSW